MRGNLPTGSHWWLEERAGPLRYFLRNKMSPRLVEGSSWGLGVGPWGEPPGEVAPSLATGMFLRLQPEAGKHNLTLLWRLVAEAALWYLALLMCWPNRTVFLGAKYKSSKCETHSV